MNNDEAETIMKTLGRLWPGKYTSDEILDFAGRMQRFFFHDVDQALNAFKEKSKFAPKVSEIIGMLKGREIKQGGVPKAANYTDERATEHPVCRNFRETQGDRNISDHEALVRYWRGQWFRAREFHTQLNAKQPPEVRARRLEHICGTFIDRCAGQLIAIGIDADGANNLATWINTSPEQFREFLADLRTMTVAAPVHSDEIP